MKKGVKIFFVLVISYFLSMTLIFVIPNKYLEKNVDNSITVFNQEGNYPIVNSADNKATKLDNFTDRLMVNKSIGSSDNPFVSAMNLNDYPRYWHGYQTILRPLLSLVNYSVIRQFYGLVITLLVGLNFYFLVKKLDIFVAMSLLISLYFTRFYTFFLSMQFSNVFIIAFTFNIFLLTRKVSDYSIPKISLYFFIVGSVTNFFDLLTVPLVTLGLPATVFCYLKLKDPNKKKNVSFNPCSSILSLSLSWGTGYGLTWLSKWVIATLVLRQNIIKDAFNSIIFRTEGNTQYPLDRIGMYKLNLTAMFNKFNVLLLILLIIFTICIVALKRKYLFKEISISSVLILLIVGFPYIWYMVLGNHSQIHYWFTYRLQVISVFALLSFLSYINSTLINLGNKESQI